MIYVLDALALAMGLILVVGAYRRWRWLVDPPLRLSPYYSQALLKRVLGPRLLVAFTYLIGLLIIATAALGTVLHLFRR